MWNLQVAEYRIKNGLLVPFCYVDGALREVAWAPLPGSQRAFLQCPEIEVLYEGTRGNGKTLALIMDFCQFVGIGMGAEHRGVLLRRQFPQLEEVLALARIWIPKFFPDARYNSNDHVWTFPDGATLKFSFLEHPEQFDQNIQGKTYDWVGLEEAQTWPTPECLTLMHSCLRSGHPLAKPHMRMTCNTFGIGATWIKARYRLPLRVDQYPVGPVIHSLDEDGKAEPVRRVIHGDISENLPYQYIDPGYIDRVATSTENKAKAQAWVTGEWIDSPDSVFGDIAWQWVILPTFNPPTPDRVRLGYDFGGGAPYSFLFYWISNGEDIELPDGRTHHAARGSIYILDEIYGGKGNKGLNESIVDQAARVFAKIEQRGWDPKILRRSGNVADSSIFDDEVRLTERSSYARDFERCGIVFERADKSKGSRIQGLGQLLKMLRAAEPPREQPSLHVTDNCSQWLDHIPKLQRDPKDPEDVDTEQPDHDYDCTRYILRREIKVPVRTGRIEQLYPNARGRFLLR